MRCINCGWNNPDGLNRCQKCNQPLPVVPVAEERKSAEKVKPESSFQATMRDATRTSSEEIGQNGRATKLAASIVKTAVKKTGGLKLVPLESGDTILCDTFPFTVNRATCASFDISVDKRSQAELTKSEDGFYIQDNSAAKSTYVLASRKIKLEEGDIVVMGGKRFIVG